MKLQTNELSSVVGITISVLSSRMDPPLFFMNLPSLHSHVGLVCQPRSVMCWLWLVSYMRAAECTVIVIIIIIIIIIIIM